MTEPALASQTSGGGLPYEDWLTKISNSITGPVAFTIAIAAIVTAGGALIFGGTEFGGFVKTLIFLGLVLGFIVAGKNTLAAITGQGAELCCKVPHPSSTVVDTSKTVYDTSKFEVS